MDNLHFDTQFTAQDVAVICSAYSLFIEEAEQQYKRYYNAPLDKKRNVFNNINIAKDGMNAFINQEPLSAAQIIILYSSLQYLKELVVDMKHNTDDTDEVADLRDMREQINTVLTKLKPLYDSVKDTEFENSYL